MPHTQNIKICLGELFWVKSVVMWSRNTFVLHYTSKLSLRFIEIKKSNKKNELKRETHKECLVDKRRFEREGERERNCLSDKGKWKSSIPFNHEALWREGQGGGGKRFSASHLITLIDNMTISLHPEQRPRLAPLMLNEANPCVFLIYSPLCTLGATFYFHHIHTAPQRELWVTLHYFIFLARQSFWIFHFLPSRDRKKKLFKKLPEAESIVQ